MSASDELLTYLNGAATIPPNGVVPDLDNPPHHNGWPIALAVVCILLATAAGLARAYSRLFVIRKLRLEDYLGLCAYGSYISYMYCYFRFANTVGFYIHLWNLRGTTLVEISYIGFIVDITYSLLLLFAKTAILLEWVRIFVPDLSRNWFYWAARIMMVINFCLYFSTVLSTVGACQPVERMWKFWLPGTCIDRKARDIVNAVFNTVADFFILLLPQPIIWTLHMTTERKLAVSVVFSVGLLVLACSIGRLYATVTLDYPDDFSKTFDTSYQFSSTLAWIVPEITCVLLVFCVPALPKALGERGRVLGSRIAASWRSWTRLSRGSRNPTQSDSSNARKVVWPPTIGSAPNKKRAHAYTTLDEEIGTNTLHTSTTELAPIQTPGLEQTSGVTKADSTSIYHYDDAALKASTESCVGVGQEQEHQNHWTKQ
ncbi:hypothetical protein GGS26DRAFT_176551 [Hypomontagnella submonticulosa]|nr:hypothetical protein GGS26DRAFT_176551 [Hypomontagnella submonticulosa]